MSELVEYYYRRSQAIVGTIKMIFRRRAVRRLGCRSGKGTRLLAAKSSYHSYHDGPWAFGSGVFEALREVFSIEMVHAYRSWQQVVKRHLRCNPFN